MLASKSIHDLRAIAQSFAIVDVFSKDAVQLRQAIELKQSDMAKPKQDTVIERHAYDARLMTKPPAKMGYEDDVRKLLEPYVKIGLHLSFPEPEVWSMTFGKKNDTGSMRMPLRTILACAEKLARGKGQGSPKRHMQGKLFGVRR